MQIKSKLAAFAVVIFWLSVFGFLAFHDSLENSCLEGETKACLPPEFLPIVMVLIFISFFFVFWLFFWKARGNAYRQTLY